MTRELIHLADARTRSALGNKVYRSRASLRMVAIWLLLLPICFLVAATQSMAQKKNSCVECHQKVEGRFGEPARLIKDDIHIQNGLACNDCHGGDPLQDDKNAAKDPRKGFIGKPKPADIPAFCGKCHNDATLMKKYNPALRVDQEKEYLTSVHGQLLKRGEQSVATCVSCHGVHGIRAVSDPLSAVYPSNVAETCAKCHGSSDYMSRFGIPSNQYARYKTSVHAKALYDRQDLSAPTCNDCHGNHGAAPPGIASVANVCGQCHVRQAELFQASPHKVAFDNMQFGECIKCHSNHDIAAPSDRMIGTSEGSLCITCHKPGDKGWVAAGDMRNKIDQLLTGIARSSEILDRAERAGMEVSRPKFDLREATDAVTHSRVLIHSSSPAELNKVADPGLGVITKAYQAGEAALAELRYRRKGLVVSLVFLLFLALLVYLKVKQIEKAQTA